MMIDTLKYRAEQAFNQILRYGDTLFTEEIADLLDELAELNDDMNHARDLKKTIDSMRLILDKIEAQKWAL